MKTDTSLLCTFCAFMYFVIHSACASYEGYDNYLTKPDEFGSEFSQHFFDGLKFQEHELDLQNKNLSSIFSNTSKEYRQRLIGVISFLKDQSPEKTFELLKFICAKTSSKLCNNEKIEKVQILLGKETELSVKLLNKIATFVRSSTNKTKGEVQTRFPFPVAQSNRRSSLISSYVSTTQKYGTGVKYKPLYPIAFNDQRIRYFNLEPKQTKYNERHKRSVTKLIHKLIRIPSFNSTEEETHTLKFESSESKLNTSKFESSESKLNTSKFESSESKLNTSNFVGQPPVAVTEINPGNVCTNSPFSFEQIEENALADLNGTGIVLGEIDSTNEQLPDPEELVSDPRYRTSNKKHRINFVEVDTKRKRLPFPPHQIKILQKQCERFTASMCIKADDYPLEQIMGSIRRHKNAMSALLAEYRDKTAELEHQEQLEEYQFNSKRRGDGSVITPGGMCASVIRYARPQKARSASGEWKYIVNTGRHTQTLRLEKCSTPQESCSYLSHNYRSRCNQVYNYHRLLSWDKTRGLHVDIFKVPTCCSCQVDGYRETFPPLGGKKHKDYTPVPENNPFISVNDEIDYEDVDEEDPLNGYHFGGSFHKNSYQHPELQLESKTIKTKVNHPSSYPSVGSYLSPPSELSDSKFASKVARPTYFTKFTNKLSGRSRKPFTNVVPNVSRADLGVSEANQSGLESKQIHATNDGLKLHQKRTRLYSAIANAETLLQKSISSPEHTTARSHILGVTSLTKDSSNRKDVFNGQRINYNYHPIIDFFESHQKSEKGQNLLESTVTNSVPLSAETSTYRDRKIVISTEELKSNNWHPVVVKS